MMSRCKAIQELLALRAEDRSAEESGLVEAHLAACPDCAALARAYAEQDRILRSAPPLSLTPIQRSQLLSRISSERRRLSMSIKLSSIFGAAASIAILVAMALGLNLLFKQHLQTATLPIPNPNAILPPTQTIYPAADSPIQPGESVTAIAVASDGALWVGTSDLSIYRLDAEGWTDHSAIAAGMEGGRVSAIAATPDGTVWIGTREGLLRFAGETWITYTAADGLAGDEITSLAVAPEGALWAGASVVGVAFEGAGGGISRFDGASWASYSIDDGPTDAYSIPSIAAAPDGTLWAVVTFFDSGGATPAISRFAAGKWTTFTPEDGLPGVKIRHIAAAPDGALWGSATDLASDPAGDSGARERSVVFRFDGQDWTIYTPEDGLPQAEISAIVTAPDGAVWIGADGAGIARFDGLTWTTYTAQDGLASDTVSAMTTAPDGALWIGAGSAISHFAPPEETAPTDAPTPTLPPTPELAAGVDAIIDCAEVYPGLPGCGREDPLVGGRLAFVDGRERFEGRVSVIDLETGDAWMSLSPAWPDKWSPSGERLLLSLLTGETVAYRSNGEFEASFELPLAPPFWAPPDALPGAYPGAHDWLAQATADGGLEAVPFPQDEPPRQILPPGSLGSDSKATVLWAHGGLLAWTPTLDQLQESGLREQTLYVQQVPFGEEEPAAWRLSGDIHEAYYILLDWAPDANLLLAGQQLHMSSSMLADGAPLFTINAKTGEITDMGVTMLLTREAYAWHPTQSGLLALAAGGGRFLTDPPKRLAVLDVTSGSTHHLTDEETVVFEPAWSPNGSLLAYAAVPASPGAAGDGAGMEEALAGRAIHVVDPATGESRALTEPGDEAIDGWPRWSADGARLLYTRQHDGVTDVRVAALDGSSDDLLLTGLPDRTCYYNGCQWAHMLAYHPGP